jgi:hypothetical protein
VHEPPLDTVTRRPTGAPGLVVFALANAMIVQRYVHGRIPLSWLVTAVYVVALLAVPYAVALVPRRWLTLRLYAVACFVIALSGLGLLVAVDAASLDVDRWSAITAFWDAALRGDYPYAARSHLGGYSGQFPFFFLLALPVYALGEIGLLALGAWLAFLAAVWRLTDAVPAFTVLVLSVAGAGMWWEVGARSNLFANMALVMVVLVVGLRRPPTKVGRAAVLGVGSGLVLSTRGIVALPLAGFAASAFVWCPGRVQALPLARAVRGLAGRRGLRLAVYGLVAVAVFAATFLPLAVWGIDEVRRYNPFEFQSRFVPWWAVAVALVAAVSWAGRTWRLSALCGRLSVLVLAVAAVHVGELVVRQGFDVAVYGGEADVSFFVLALPLALGAVAARPG